MGTIECNTDLYELTPLHEKILYAEKHKKNYDIYFAVNYDHSLTSMELDQAVHYVFNATEVLNCVVIQTGSRYVLSAKHYHRENDFRSATPLRNKRIDIFKEQLLANYYIDEGNHRIEFLIHHLVFDGDSLYELLDKIEKVVVRKEKLTIQEQKYESLIALNPSNEVNGYRDGIESLPNTRRVSMQLDEPFYDNRKLSKQAYKAVGSLSQKLRVTKFGVILFATAMLSHHKQNIIGIVVSRKDKRTQSQTIGNFTDVVPYLLQVDVNRSYMDNANIIFKQLFGAIVHSADLSYDQYMNMVGVRGYECILSYTKMSTVEQHSTIFSQLELGEYLYKYDNHLQFIEHKEDIAVEFRCDNLALHHVYLHLEEMLLVLDQIDLSVLAQQQLMDQGDVPMVTHVKEVSELKSVDCLFPGYQDEMNMFDSNISSFDIAHIITDVYENFGVQLSYQDIYASHTIKELKLMIMSKVGMNSLEEVRDGHDPNDYVCPNFIKAIFIDSFRFINSEMYNVKYAYRLTDDVCKQLHRLRHAINQVIQHNEVFFTKFEYVKGDIIATIKQSEKYDDIEQIDVETLADMCDLKSVLRIQGDQKLWDIRLIRVRTNNEIYLYINMHHILVDHIGMGILLNQIESNYHNKEVNYAQYRNIAGHYDVAKVEDLNTWQSSLLKHSAFVNQGKSSMGNGQFNLYEWKCYVNYSTYEEMESVLLTTITNRLANYFKCTQGYIGAVYHGRVVPKANQVISSFARVLPIFFDVQDKLVIQESLRTARHHQSVSLYDLNESGFELEFPKVVFQTLYANVNEPSFFNHTMEFEGISKFQLFINLYVGTEECKVSVYIDNHLYSDEEVQIINSALVEAIDDLKRSEGEEVYV
ncbi:condensation domain-containing protein [Paenibacillus macquariensis]|uniref:Condensation domain-containing protein n=1 Tax=Paenibacillus macquariensis TaxID=948756 RepID=A0ABY1K2Y5_9BACL|nr:condensation domain-containing protein [Paenibacillus macquariensis]MEC0090282.1 condensation domain-containing protein [Paenibacillus macquariensis]OAB39642.1 hypothetical protein PMSM_00500 [Paenibacillus macquariensis subsp. macquariensis]SIR18767.1 Condensation domain-containing protein [Paenibacillus macquariensis]